MRQRDVLLCQKIAWVLNSFCVSAGILQPCGGPIFGIENGKIKKCVVRALKCKWKCTGSSVQELCMVIWAWGTSSGNYPCYIPVRTDETGSQIKPIITTRELMSASQEMKDQLSCSKFLGIGSFFSPGQCIRGKSGSKKSGKHVSLITRKAGSAR